MIKWAKIDGFDRYSISDHGDVWSSIRKKILSKNITYGYEYVGLMKDGKRHIKYIHRLVGQAFVENPKNKPQINHLDSNRINNHFSNLEWCTHYENFQHAARNGRMAHGERHWKAKVTKGDVVKIRELRKTKKLREIAEIYDMQVHAISCICRKATWKHI